MVYIRKKKNVKFDPADEEEKKQKSLKKTKKIVAKLNI